MADSQYTVEHFVAKLKPRVEAAVGAYEHLADDLAEAWQKLKHADFKELCARIGVEYETGYRLAKNALCPRLKNYAPQLPGIGWGTQDAVRRLSETEFNQFAADHLKPGG